jgi:hypothetical protein
MIMAGSCEPAMKKAFPIRRDQIMRRVAAQQGTRVGRTTQA